ncbi:outer membrane lipoprotein-sorting protein [Marinilabiliaceae bacterium ANBcel2]|nr:outer membrane lipoprotein-sorting protein [Marinilabiliaceae bacterium ANBcel2]
MKKTLLFIFLLSLLFDVTAENSQAKTLFLNSVKKIAYSDVVVDLLYEQKERRGNITKRELKLSLGKIDNENFIMVELISPGDVAGTKILFSDCEDKRDFVDLFLPASGRVQRLKVEQTEMEIMGQSFSFYQFQERYSNGYTFEFSGVEECGNSECDRIAIHQNGEEEFKMAYVDRESGLLTKFEYYNSAGAKESYIEFIDYNDFDKIDGKVYPRQFKFYNLRTGQKSTFFINSFELLIDGDADYFDISLCN